MISITIRPIHSIASSSAAMAVVVSGVFREGARMRTVAASLVALALISLQGCHSPPDWRTQLDQRNQPPAAQWQQYQYPQSSRYRGSVQQPYRDYAAEGRLRQLQNGRRRSGGSTGQPWDTIRLHREEPWRPAVPVARSKRPSSAPPPRGRIQVRRARPGTVVAR